MQTSKQNTPALSLLMIESCLTIQLKNNAVPLISVILGLGKSHLNRNISVCVPSMSIILAKNNGIICYIYLKHVLSYDAVFMYCPRYPSCYQHCLWEWGGGGCQNDNESFNKVIATAYICVYTYGGTVFLGIKCSMLW